MKHIILTALLMVSASMNQANACTIDIKIKKAEAKSGITQSGASMSLATLEKTGCKITKSLFSEAELKQYKIKDLESKLAKLKK